MNEQTLKDYETLLEHWNTAFKLTRMEKDRSEWTAREDGWKELVPAEKPVKTAFRHLRKPTGCYMYRMNIFSHIKPSGIEFSHLFGI